MRGVFLSSTISTADVVRFAPFRRVAHPVQPAALLTSHVRLRSGDRASGSVATAWVKKMALDEVPTTAATQLVLMSS